MKVALAALASAGALLVAAPYAASAAPVGADGIAAQQKLDNSLVEKVYRRWRYRDAYYYRPYYQPYGYSYYQPYYRPYYRPYYPYYGAYGYPYYGAYYRPYFGPRFYGPRFGFSVGF
jgi:hypothetical protein